MKGASAPVRGALLGLVLESPGSGGELARRLDARFGESWKVDRRDVYRLLEALEREGLLQCHEERRDRRLAAARLVYHPTSLTSAALGQWIGSACAREPARPAIEAKLLVASERDAPALQRLLTHYELECLALVQSLPPCREPEGALRPARPLRALLDECVRDGMLARLQAEIDWAQATRRRIEEHLRLAG